MVISVSLNHFAMRFTDVTEFLVNFHLAGGVLINTILLYAIRRFSRPIMGTYKYLLAAFAAFDVFLSLAHATTRPVKQRLYKYIIDRTQTVVILDTIFGVVTDMAFQDSRITAAYCACFTVPFTLMNIHFLYRFWSIRYPDRIALFSNKKFIAFIIEIPITEFIVWYYFCAYVMYGDGVSEASARLLRDEYERRYGKVIEKGWMLVNHAEEGGLRVRAFAAMTTFNIIMIGSFTVAVILARLTYKYISKADKLSSQALNLQYKLLIATFVPVVCVYLPYMGVNNLAFLRLPAHSIDRACMQLNACFPMWDAIIIIGLIKDYREGLLSIVRPKTEVVQVETKWKTTDVSMAATSVLTVS